MSHDIGRLAFKSCCKVCNAGEGNDYRHHPDCLFNIVTLNDKYLKLAPAWYCGFQGRTLVPNGPEEPQKAFDMGKRFKNKACVPAELLEA